MSNDKPAGKNLLSNQVTVETIRNFLADEHKPTDLEPIDLLHMVYLMLRKAEDGGILDSQQLIARRLNCSVHTISRSQKRLAASKLDYIARTRRKGRTSELSINIDKIPAEEPLRVMLSDDAARLAALYSIQLRTRRVRRKFPKHFVDLQKVSAQRILNTCSGNLELAQRMIEHSLDMPLHRGKASKSLYHLFGIWPKVQQSYAVSLRNSPQEPTPSVTIEKLTRAVLKLDLTANTQQEWAATIKSLSERGNSPDHIRAVFKRRRETAGDDAMRVEGAAGFEQNFAALSAAMQQSKEAA